METVAAVTAIDEPGASQSCPVLALEGHMMQLKSAKPLGIGSAVKVESDDTLALGEVSYCRPDGDGFVLWVDLMQALHNVEEMTRLARALLADGR
jgi:hypothetical protein